MYLNSQRYPVFIKFEKASTKDLIDLWGNVCRRGCGVTLSNLVKHYFKKYLRIFFSNFMRNAGKDTGAKVLFLIKVRHFNPKNATNLLAEN